MPDTAGLGPLELSALLCLLHRPGYGLMVFSFKTLYTILILKIGLYKLFLVWI